MDCQFIFCTFKKQPSTKGTDSHKEPLLISNQPQSQRSPCLCILITGRCGSGKSALINALLGEVVVSERLGVHDRSRSREVESYNTTKSFYPVRVWVSTQLQHLDYADERQYERELKTKCGKVDLIIYCLKMTETRFTPGNPDEVAMGKLYKALGAECVKKTIFALTFANNAATIMETETFRENATEQWPAIITNTLKRVTKVTSPVRVLPVGYYKEPSLPICQNWLEPLWCQCLEVMPKESEAKMAANAMKKDRLQLWNEGEQVKLKDPSSFQIVFDSKAKLDRYYRLAEQAS